MSAVKDDTIGGFNTFLEEQKKLDGDARITVALFSDGFELLADRIDIHEFEGLNDKNYKPVGFTALLDTIGNVIGMFEDKGVNKNYVVAILTDGHENGSREYDLETISSLISEKTEQGWQFIYLGANQDAIKEAGKLGINKDYAGTFVPDGFGTKTAILNASEMVSSYRSSGEMLRYADVDMTKNTSSHNINVSINTTKTTADDIANSLKKLSGKIDGRSE